MELNYIAIGIATVLQFICGAIWYMFIFGKTWGKIHGFDECTKEEQDVMRKGMGPFYVLQVVVTFVTTLVLALFVAGLPLEWNIYGIAGFLWIGFVVPTQISAVIFGGTAPQWIFKKIGIMAGGSLICLMGAALVLDFI